MSTRVGLDGRVAELSALKKEVVVPINVWVKIVRANEGLAELAGASRRLAGVGDPMFTELLNLLSESLDDAVEAAGGWHLNDEKGD